jgi:hypothetical protein
MSPRSRRTRPYPLRVALLAAAVAAETCTPFKPDLASDLDALASPALAGVNDNGPDAGAHRACDLSKPFGAPTLVPGLESSGSVLIDHLVLSPDSLTGYFSEFSMNAVHTSWGLYTARRPTVSGPFEIAGTLGDTTATNDERAPTVSGDGLTLIFALSANGGPYQLRYGVRTGLDVPFDRAGPVPGLPHSMEGGIGFLLEDGRVLYVASSTTTGKSDIYQAAWSGSAFDSPVPVAELNTPFDESNPAVTPDDRTIYFNSNRPSVAGQGSWQIWTSTRASTNDPFSAPTNVTELNSTDGRRPTFVSRDGCALYFDTFESGIFPTGAQYVAEKPAQ